jgi:hypothetical protein
MNMNTRKLKCHILGIDPGLRGGVVGLDLQGNLTYKGLLPVKDREIDVVKLKGMFDDAKPFMVFMEKVHALPMVGVGSTFKFGYVYGQLQATLRLIGAKLELVPPKTWQKIEIPEEFEGNTKERALRACKALYPDIDLRATERSKKFHDGLVDAFFIASYGLKHFK